MIGKLSKDEISRMLLEQRVGRIACSAGDRPYIVPMHYVYEEGSIYSFTHSGRKLDVMRAQPNVAFEIEQIDSAATWRTVVAEGLFIEVTEQSERLRILQRLEFGLGCDGSAEAYARVEDLVVFQIAVQATSGRFQRR